MMRAIGLFGVLVLCILLLPAALADGMAFEPKDMVLSRTIDENTQLAYIEVTDETYTTYLYVEFDFVEYPKETMLWVVPFEDYPTDVDLGQVGYTVFRKRFEELDDKIEVAKGLQEEYDRFDGNYAIGLGLQYLGFVGIVPAGFLYFMGATMSSIGVAGAEWGPAPLDVYRFGELGMAEVYQASEGQTLRALFQQKGITPPAEISQYLDKYIVVFTINRHAGPLGVLATFTFDNDGSIFYPSGTTQYFKEPPADYQVRVVLPRGYKTSWNMDPAIDVADESSRYLIFTRYESGYSRVSRALCEVTPCESDDDCLDTDYCGQGATCDTENDYPGYCRWGSAIPTKCNGPLCVEDLEITLTPSASEKAPLGMFLIKYIGTLPIILIMIVLGWFASIYLIGKVKNKAWTLRETLQLLLLNMFFTGLITAFSCFVVPPLFNSEKRKSPITRLECFTLFVFSLMVNILLFILVLGLFGVRI